MQDGVPAEVSVIIPAHNEETVLAACLDAVLAQHGVRAEVIVSANGCTDATVEVARSRDVTVLEGPEPGKAAALNAADAVASYYPRVFLDADIVLPPHAVTSLLRALETSPNTLAAVPRRRVDATNSALLVKAYFAINEKLPVFRDALFGRGVIAMRASGRRRFTEFPHLIADDLFLDSLFHSSEKAVAADVEVVVMAPRRVSELVRRLVRVRRGNAQLRAAQQRGDVAASVRRPARWSWLRDVVAHEPRLAAAAIPYVLITASAAAMARLSRTTDWGQVERTLDRSNEAAWHR